jgi:hypothetical protein
MSEALLKNTFNKISPAYELVADVIVGTATTQVDFSGLNFGKDDDLMLVYDLLKPSTSSNEFYIYANANYTNTNYYTQQLYAEGTSVGAGRYNIPLIDYLNQANNNSIGFVNIKLTNNGYVVFQNNINTRFYNSNTANIHKRYITSTFTATSLTSLRFSSQVTNQISVGSRFQLYRLKAKKVADIIVSTATTQVDITGLSIDKDSEYMLVSDIVQTINSYSNFSIFANGNNTGTNYYTQMLWAYGTVVSGQRLNASFIYDINNSGSCLAMTNLKLTNNGYLTSQSNIASTIGGANILIQKNYATSTFTLTSITSLRIASSLANGIGIGSRFTLYKMR